MVKILLIIAIFLVSISTANAEEKIKSTIEHKQSTKNKIDTAKIVDKVSKNKNFKDSISVKNDKKINDSTLAILDSTDSVLGVEKKDSVDYSKILSKMITKDSLKKIVPIKQLLNDDASSGIDSIEKYYKMGKSDKCPDDMVLVEGKFYYIDFLGIKKIAKQLSYCIDRYEFPNIRGRYPTQNVTLHEAKKMCKQRGKRLCRDSEWQMACKSGDENNKYSYGKKYNEDKCNVNSRVMTKSGDFYQCHTDRGVFDMSGNLEEWTNGGGVGVYGGNFKSSKNSKCSNWKSYNIKYKSDNIGFRCCSDAN